MGEDTSESTPEPPPRPSTEPVHGIDLAAYAALSAALATGKPCEALLAEHNLTEIQWMTIERSWALRLAAHAQRGENELLFEFERAYSDALQALTPAEPPHPLPMYAQIVSALESGIPTPVICMQTGLSLADLGQLQRAWTQRLAKDPALNSEFQDLRRDARGKDLASSNRTE